MNNNADAEKRVAVLVDCDNTTPEILDYTLRVVNPTVSSFLEYVAQNVFPDPDKSIIYELHKHFGLSVERIELFLIEAAVRAWSPWSQPESAGACDFEVHARASVGQCAFH